MQLREILVISETGVNYCNKRGKILKKQHFGQDLKNNHFKKNCKILDVFLMHLRKVLVISETGVNYRKRGKIKKAAFWLIS